MERKISFTQALSTVVGTVIGAGVFFKIGAITQQTGDASLTLFVWLLAGIISIASGLTVSEIAAALPVTGGSIHYIKYTYNDAWGFLFGWAQMVIYYPAIISALSVIFGQQLTTLLGISPSYTNLIAVLLVIFLMLPNFISNNFSSKLQSVLTFLKIIPIALIILFGLFNKNKINFNIFPIQTGPGKSFTTALSSGLLSALFAYDGWITVTNLAGEIKNPEKNLSRAIIIGLSISTIIFLLINYTFLTVLPFNEITGNQNTAYLASIKLFGNFGGKLITIGILLSIYGAVNASILTGIRIPYTLALDKKLPFHKSISKLSIHTGVPVISALIILFISITMILLGSFNILSNMLIFVMWTFSTLISIAVIILRFREPELTRPYKVPLYPIIPLISIFGGLFIIISTIINQFFLSITGIGITLLGLSIYYYVQHNNKKSK